MGKERLWPVAVSIKKGDPVGRLDFEGKLKRILATPLISI